jgi:CDGSH-type Zn-finger protein
MAETTIQVKPRGPYVVTGVFTVLDAEGRKVETKEKVSLCRCGASMIKPFCDGSHKSCGFEGGPVVAPAPAPEVKQ